MRDFDEHNITQSVIERFGNTPDPRLKTILNSLVTHLHDFIRDVDLSFEEWQAAIKFLTRTGQQCTDTRQEFILLSDTLGVSMLVDAINHRHRNGATETTVLGPFFVNEAPALPMGANIAPNTEGEPLHASGVIRSTTGAPLANAKVEVWQCNKDGFYDVQMSPKLNLRASFTTDEQGRFAFWSILPTSYPIPYDGPVGDLLKATNRHPYRPAHLHFMISAPGHETLVTHVFVKGDQYLDSDAVFGVKNSLIEEFKQHVAGTNAPDGTAMTQSWRSFAYDFSLKADA